MQCKALQMHRASVPEPLCR